MVRKGSGDELKKPRKKKCKVCGERFQPERPIQPCCSIPCAIEWVEIKREEKRSKETRRRKDDLKSLSDLLKEAQPAFNAYIRQRDKGQPCISCGKNSGAKMNAGHYLTVGAHPELRFNEDNCHLQCEWCNSYLSGNIARYRINLIKKIGLERVEKLEGPHPAKNYTREEAREKKAEYLRKIKELKNV